MRFERKNATYLEYYIDKQYVEGKFRAFLPVPQDWKCRLLQGRLSGGEVLGSDQISE
jgi:hypothetical protein